MAHEPLQVPHAETAALLHLAELYQASVRKKKVLLKRHPELLGESADGLMARATAAAFEDGDEESVHLLEWHRLLLRRCRDIGISAAFAEIKTSVPTPQAFRSVADDLSEKIPFALDSDELPVIDAVTAQLKSVIAQNAWDNAPPEFKSIVLSSVGNLLSHRYKLSGEPDDLRGTIDNFQQAIAALPPGWSEGARDLNNLGNALRDRYEITGEIADLDRAIEAFEDGLARTRPGWSIHSTLLNGLATVLSVRYERAGDVADLDRSNELLEEVVTNNAGQHEEILSSLANLGHGLELRYLRTGDQASLEKSIELLEEVVSHAPARSTPHLAALANLSISLRARYKRSGEIADLERSVALSEEMLDLLPPGAPDRAAHVSGVGIGLQDLFERTDDVRLLEKAIEMYEGALAQAPPSSPSRRRLLTNLGNGLEARYLRDGSIEDLDRAVGARQEALRNSDPDSPLLAARLSNLGATLILRYHRRDDPRDLDLAIDAHKRAVAVTAPQAPQQAGNLNNLATALETRYRRTHMLKDLVDAINAYRQACSQGIGTEAESGLIAARNWGHLASDRKQWADAVEAYGYALGELDRLYRLQFGRPHKEAWLREAQGLTARAAYAHAERGNLERAVTVLEHGRALLLSETLERDQAQLDRLAELGFGRLAERYREAANLLAGPESSADGTQLVSPERLRAARDELQAVISEIRAVEGYERFLDPANFADVAVAAATAPLAYLAATGPGGLGLLVTADAAVVRVPLPELTLSSLQRVVNDYFRAYSLRHNDPGGWLTTLDRVTRWLWDHVMEPVLAAMAPATRVVLVPVGLLGFLPLHAAWVEDERRPTGRRYALDDALCTYAPNARALATATGRTASISLDNLLAIDDPQWNTHPVPNADYEVSAALASMPRSQRLQHEAATKAATLAALTDRAVLHFACHGRADLAEPLASALVLAGGERLTLREVLDHRLPRTRLAVLSACETAVPGSRLPDEVVGLPTGLLAAGAAGVVGSLWSVADVSTMLVMVRFYAELRGVNVEPAEALRRAQCWVRDKTNADKAASFPDILALAGADVSARHRDFWESAQAHDHPYYWAAFAFIGA